MFEVVLVNQLIYYKPFVNINYIFVNRFSALMDKNMITIKKIVRNGKIIFLCNLKIPFS